MSLTYFEIFGLPRHLQLDAAALEKAFYAQSRKLHPDRFAAHPPAEQEAALAASSTLNDAYRTLKDAIARTQYLLTIEGVEMEEQSKAATEAARTSGEQKKQLVPPQLLEEVFELNMQLAEMKSAKQMGDAADPSLLHDLQVAASVFQDKLDGTQSELEILWQRWDEALDSAEVAEQNLAKEAMVALLNRRTYLRNLVRDVDAALEA